MRYDKMLRATGAAPLAPYPAWSTTTTTTNRGAPAGAMPTKRAVGYWPVWLAVPVFPATGNWASGKPTKAE